MRVPSDSAKCYTQGVVQDQLSLFSKKFPSSQQAQPVTVKPPAADNTVLGTLHAYFIYLSSGQYSKYTPGDFTRDVRKFGLFVRDKKVREIRVQDVQQWLSQLTTPAGVPLNKKTISRKVTALNNYFSWLIRENVIEENPALAIRNHRVISPLPNILTETECMNLLHCASTEPRRYVFVQLLLETGMKIEEIFSLRVEHLDLSNKYSPSVWIKHTGMKVKKDRKLKLPPDIVPALTDYFQAHHIEDLLFPVTPRLMQVQLKNLGEEAGVRRAVTGQILRDTCAVRWLQRGEDMDTVLTKLGLRPATWDDAKEKYLKLAGEAL